MTNLTPELAAQLADAVYGIRLTDNVIEGVANRIGGTKTRALADLVDLEGADVAHGTAGNVITARTGFGLVMRGHGGSAANSTVVVARGTHFSSMTDWLTNATTGYAVGPTGLGVHAGFNRTFKSMSKDIFPKLPDTGTVHVVGHSLGGALANLIAAKLSGGAHNVKLYTFGSPRVGLAPFSAQLQSRLKPENIHRVYAVADPVPMVPIYPFAHAPLSQAGIRVGNSTGLISVGAHSMQDNYIKLMQANNSWAGLRTAGREVQNYRRVDEWLELAGKRSSIPGSTWTLWALGKALQALVDFAILNIGITVMVAATAIDTIAQLLVHAARLARDVSRKIMRFIELAMKWAGKTVVRGAEVTAQFLAWVIRLMLAPIGSLAARALERLLS